MALFGPSWVDCLHGQQPMRNCHIPTSTSRFPLLSTLPEHRRCVAELPLVLSLAWGGQASLGAPPSSSWLPLAPPGSLWLLLALPGSSWLLLAPHGSSWLLMAPPGSPLLLLALPGSFDKISTDQSIRSQEARKSQEEPGGARRSQEEP